MPADKNVAIITGAAQGIGKACALRFTDAGVRVLIADKNQEMLQQAANAMVARGGEVLTAACDVSDEEACSALAQQALSAWGRIDMLVANAGVQIGGNLMDASEADWTTILSVNLRGVANSCKAVLPAMRQQSAGSIVIVSSVNALVAAPGMTVYDISKAGVLGLNRSLAAEYGPHGIRVNAICPGNTLTDFHINNLAAQGITVEQIREMTAGYGLLGRIAEPGEIANAAWFLAGTESSFITGHTLVVDGGFSVSGAA